MTLTRDEFVKCLMATGQPDRGKALAEYDRLTAELDSLRGDEARKEKQLNELAKLARDLPDDILKEIEIYAVYLKQRRGGAK